MLDEVDRVVAVAGNAGEAELLGRVAAAVEGRNLEVILVSDEARSASRAWSLELLKRIVRECPRQQGFPLADADLAWVARHLTRTKLGVALGAGGAKGYAHVGVLQVLEEAGYTVDYAGGSSIEIGRASCRERGENWEGGGADERKREKGAVDVQRGLSEVGEL